MSREILTKVAEEEWDNRYDVVEYTDYGEPGGVKTFRDESTYQRYLDSLDKTVYSVESEHVFGNGNRMALVIRFIRDDEQEFLDV